VLAAIADLSADVAPDSLAVIGDRVFCRGRIDYEVTELPEAWQRFSAWVDAGRAARIDDEVAGELVVERVSIAPSSGFGDVDDAVRDELEDGAWCVGGTAGLALVLRPVDGSGMFRAAAGDDDGVHTIYPEVVGETFSWQLRDDGAAALVVVDGVAWELDLVARSSRRLLEDVRLACYTADGFAAITGGDLVLFDERPEELEHVAIESESDVSDLTSTAGGRILMVGVDDRTLVVAVRGGDVYPIGRFDGAWWDAIWTCDSACYLQAEDALLRIPDGARLWSFAVGSTPIDRLAAWSVDDAHIVELPAYPDRTRWSLYGSDD
jgi:hypothetical protein